MADVAHTPSPAEVHRLQGSSSPDGERQPFEPVAMASADPPKPAKMLHPSRLFMVSNEADVSARANRLVALVKREDRLSRYMCGLNPNEETARDAARDRAWGRMIRRVNRQMLELADTQAPTLRAAGLKGNALIEVALAGWSLSPERDQLGLSVARDAAQLALAEVVGQSGDETDPLVAMQRRCADLRAVANDPKVPPGEADSACDEMANLREQAADIRARDLPGALASLEWARAEFAVDVEDDSHPDWIDQFVLAMMDSALGILRAMCLSSGMAAAGPNDQSASAHNMARVA